MGEESIRSNTFEFGATLDQLKNTLARREALPENLDKPLRSLVAQLATLIEAGAVSVYVTSEDADREVRNHFAFLLATYLRDREDTTLLVDNDYLAIGLTGLVPQKDALGFLDLLLYGSSLGVITQDGPNHLRVIGAGSFQVAKKNPFVMAAFGDSHRYLLSHSKCLLYIGPVADDDGETHPLASQVDLVIAVGAGRRQRIRTSQVEDKLGALAGHRVWHIRMVEPAESDAAVRPESSLRPSAAAGIGGSEPPPVVTPHRTDAPIAPEPPPPTTGTASDRPNVAADAGVGEDTVVLKRTPEFEAKGIAPKPFDVRPGPSAFDAGPPPGESNANAMLPKIVTFAVGFLVIAFIVWWLYQTKVFRDGSETAVAPEPVTEQPLLVDVGSQPTTVDTTAAAMSRSDGGESPIELAGEDTPDPGTETPVTGTAASQAAADTAVVNEVAKDRPAHTPATSASQPPNIGATRAEPEELALTPGVTVAQGLKGYVGSYLVHISSFRELSRAESEAQALADLGYAVVVAYVDTGSKGLYHRVYVGPYKYREAARMAKIKLDEIPFVKFTRITKM